MRSGTKVRCVDVSDGPPLTEGETYTIKAFYRNPATATEVQIPERASVPAVRLREVPGLFMATRFKELPSA